MRSGLCISAMVYLAQFVCLSDGVNLKVVATSITEIDHRVYHDVRNSMPRPTFIAYFQTILVSIYILKKLSVITLTIYSLLT